MLSEYQGIARIICLEPIIKRLHKKKHLAKAKHKRAKRKPKDTLPRGYIRYKPSKRKLKKVM